MIASPLKTHVCELWGEVEAASREHQSRSDAYGKALEASAAAERELLEAARRHDELFARYKDMNAVLQSVEGTVIAGPRHSFIERK